MIATHEVQVIYGEDDFIKFWMAKRLPAQPLDKVVNFAALGVRITGKTIAGFLFHNYFPTYGTIEVGVVADSPRWANKETMAELFAYPFEQLGVNKLWCAIERTNRLAIKTAEHAGFITEGVLADEYGPGRHAVRLRILKREFKHV